MRIGIAGLGLIGGSLALALRGRHRITGFDPDPTAREAARSGGIAIADTLDALLPADAVIVATPLPDIVPTLAALVPRADGALLLDVGSLKRTVAGFAETAPATARIVGGHPMAGSTDSGFAAADAALFRGWPFLLVPTARSDAAAMELAGTLARECGAVVTVCSAEVHDRAMAFLSAVPLAAAAAVALEGAEAAPLQRAAGPGFRDTTRLADTPVDLATELLLANSADVVDGIAKLIGTLEGLSAALASGRRDAVKDLLRAARSARDEIR